MQAIVLAAGYATRLYPLTKDFPKALLRIGGKPMMDHLVDELDKLPQICGIHVVTNSRFYAAFADWAASKRTRAALHVYDDGTADDDTKRGAIGDMEFVRQEADIREDCLVVAGDNLLKIDFAAFLEQFARHGETLLLCQKQTSLKTLRSFAVATTDAQGRILQLEEKPQEPKSDLGVFALYLYPAATFARIPEYLRAGNSPDSPGHLPEWLLKQGEPLRAFVTEEPCFDIGTHESLRHVRALYGE